MKQYSKTIASVFAGLALALSFGLVFGGAGLANAQVTTTATSTISTTDLATLQNEITQLTALVNSLRAQIAARMGGGTSGQCYTFSGSNLSFGSRSTDVTTLQQFLINKGYLHISAPTGYFGSLTQAALRSYQVASGLGASSYGIFDSATIAQINSSCQTTTTTTTTQATPVSQTTTLAPVISSFSPSSPMPGSTVTINGSGFGSGTATVYLTGPSGNITLSNISASNNGNAMTFTLPLTNALTSVCTGALTSSNCSNYLTPGSYTVYVQSPGGTSNYTSLSVIPYNANAASTTTTTTTTSTTTTTTTASTTPTVTSLSNTSGSAGSSVTITGTGFAPSGNTVTFGGTTISNITSTNNGTTIQFTVPTTTSSNLSVTPGNYVLYVNNGYGSSNSMAYTVQ